MILLEKDWLTHIYYVDDLRTYQSELAKQYAAPEKYKLEIFSGPTEFIDKLRKERTSDRIIRIAILAITSLEEEGSLLEKLEQMAKRFPDMVFLLLSKKDKEGSVLGQLPVHVRSVIPINDNAVLRINNNLKGIISEINLEQKRRSARRAIWVLAIFILLIFTGWLVLKWKFPLYL